MVERVLALPPKPLNGLKRSGEYLLKEIFLVAVADKDGLSYYSDVRVVGTLRITRPDLELARSRLVDLGLVAYQPPLYQVLALDVAPQERADAPRTLRDILGDL